MSTRVSRRERQRAAATATATARRQRRRHGVGDERHHGRRAPLRRVAGAARRRPSVVSSSAAARRRARSRSARSPDVGVVPGGRADDAGRRCRTPRRADGVPSRRAATSPSRRRWPSPTRPPRRRHRPADVDAAEPAPRTLTEADVPTDVVIAVPTPAAPAAVVDAADGARRPDARRPSSDRAIVADAAAGHAAGRPAGRRAGRAAVDDVRRSERRRRIRRTSTSTCRRTRSRRCRDCSAAGRGCGG